MARLRSLASRLAADPQRQEHDKRRNAAQPWRAWYWTARWKATRLRQLQAEPLCRMCRDQGRLTPATVCDHVEPHRGDEAKFWRGPFQSICKPCHDGDKQRVERGGKVKAQIGADGWPV